MSELHFVFAAEIGEGPLLDAIRQGFAEAQDAGLITKLREDPTGTEACVYVGSKDSPEGFATFFDAGLGRVWLDVLFVRRECRRKGIGRALLAEVARRSAGAGFKHLLFGVDADNWLMRDLVERGDHGTAPASVEFRIDLTGRA